mgnify:CR=1 FL=1
MSSDVTKWIGGSSGSWDVAKNWSNGIPSTSDTAEIDASTSISIQLSSSDATNDITITGTAAVNFSGGSIAVNGTVSVSSGQVLTLKNSNLSAGTLSGGNVDITNGSTVTVGATTSNFSFDGVSPTVTNTLTVNNVGNGIASISNLSPGDIIKFPNDSWNDGIKWELNSDGTYKILDGYGDTTPLVKSVTLASGVKTSDFSWDSKTSSIVCFLGGSLINTPSGLKAVEDLSIGDELVAYVTGREIIRRVTWAGQAHCTVRPHLPLDQAGYPVRILKDAIAEGMPFKDLLITAEHCLFFDGKFIPARMLVNGRSIFFDKSITSYNYYHIETEAHSVIMADGMLTESYLDTGNRRSFSQKGNVISIGSNSNLTWDDAAASLTVSREAVEPLFRQIENRAEKVGFAIYTEAQPVTCEHDLHLVTDTGVTIRQIRENNGRVMFMIPEGVERVRIVSNASRPCDAIGPFVDDRRTLGVLVGDVRLFEGNTTVTLTAHLQDADLSGWNNVEDGTMRWTDGNALLNLGQRPIGSIALMALQIHAAGPYLLADTTSERAALQA